MKIITKFSIATLAAVFLTPIAHIHAMDSIVPDLCDNTALAHYEVNPCGAASPAIHESNQAKTNRPLMDQDLFGRVMDRISQSNLMNRYNTWLTKNRKMVEDCDNPNAPLASEDFQQLNRDAQNAMGIPPEKQKPLKIRSDSATNIFSTTYSSIYLHEKTIRSMFFLPENAFTDQNTAYNKIDPEQYGGLSSVLHHEAAHVRFNHGATTTLLRSINTFADHPFTYLGTLSAGLLLSRNHSSILSKAQITVPCIATQITLGKINQVILQKQLAREEYRADIEGHYATECSTCVSQKARFTASRLASHRSAIATYQEAIKNPTPDLTAEQASAALKIHQDKLKWRSLYLSPEKIQLIADQLKKENKECIVHTQYRQEREVQLQQFKNRIVGTVALGALLSLINRS